MGFQVKYEEITSIRELILAQLDRWIEQIDAVRSSIVEIAAMPEMHGEAAEHVRSYMWDYHMNLANMIKDTIETYRSSFILYTDWYYNIDSDQMAEMSQDSMEGLEENIQGARSDFDVVAEEVADIERELSAYLDVGRFSTTCMESCFDNALAGVQNVRTQIGEYEEAHSHADMYPIDMMVGYLRSIIGGQLGGSSATISAYDASVVNATESFQLAQMMDGMLSTYLEQVKDRVNSCEEFYELQQQQWQESIRLRTEEGIVKTLVGVGTMILGGMLVVATCGMALPLVTTVGVVAIGLGTAAYGCANAIEGSQDVYAGVTGDPRMVSVNPIRDTVFASNPDLYYLIGNVLTIAASLILTGGMAANAAVSAGTSIGRAVVTEYAKQGLTVAASSYVDKRMTEATNSPLAGFVVGSLTGMATYGTLSGAELEVVNNVKRPQQLGNVGESGRNTATTIDYSYKFDRELANFNDGYEIRTTVDKDLILVQYSSDAPDASLCYWTTVDEANGITTLNDYMDKLALSKDWGNRNTVKVARIPAGTEVKYAVGTAREQLLIADPRPGGGVQYLFNQFDTDWITEIRSFSN
ncbi:MAG: T7SS effector LXG polymorphic toxin [Roseburia sp.]